MELYIFSSDLIFLGVIDSFISLRWVRRYSKYGEFELQCAFTWKALNYLMRTNIIYKKDDVEAGVINTLRIRQDTEGNDIIVANGMFLTGYLARRLVWGLETLNEPGEIAMRTLVTKNCITPTDPTRVIPLLELGELNNFTESVDYQVYYQNLLTEMESLSNLTQLGYRVRFDRPNKKLIFEIYKGLDRTVNQDINPRAIFAKEFDNILDSEYIDSLSNYANVVLVGGTQDDPFYPSFLTVGAASGLDRFEVFNDQNGIATQDDNGYLTVDAYNNLLIGKGNEALTSAKELKTFTSTINTNGNLKYKEEFDLGDIITIVSKKWGVTLDTRITEVEEIYETAGLKINVIFGNDVPTLLDKVKSITKQKSSYGGGTAAPLTSIDGGSFI